MIEIPDSVFPTNDDGEAICGKCKKSVKECECVAYDPSQPKLERYHVTVRKDSKNRRGKSVILIEGLPNDARYCKTLAKELKTRTGSGGSSFVRDGMGVIEIQGHNIDQIKQILIKSGFDNVS